MFRPRWSAYQDGQAASPTACPPGGGDTTHECMGSRDAGQLLAVRSKTPFLLGLVRHASPSPDQITTGRPVLPTSHMLQRKLDVPRINELVGNTRRPGHRRFP